MLKFCLKKLFFISISRLIQIKGLNVSANYLWKFLNNMKKGILWNFYTQRDEEERNVEKAMDGIIFRIF